MFNTDDPNIEFDLTSSELGVKENNHLTVKILTTMVPKNAADAIINSVNLQQAAEPKEKVGIIKKIGRKIVEKREARYYRDEE